MRRIRRLASENTFELTPNPFLIVAVSLLMSWPGSCVVAQSTPTLATVFPAGGQSGQSVDVHVTGSPVPFGSLISNLPGFQCTQVEPNRFRISIPQGVVPGSYEVWGLGPQGISSPRTFCVSNRPEQLEVEPNSKIEPNAAQSAATPLAAIPLSSVVNGRIGEPGDVDDFRFEAQRGQRIIIECCAERIDSRLRAVLELFDAGGRRLATNRGYFGIDPLIDFRVPVDGTYVVRLSDLVSGGSPEHYYRLEIDHSPRVLFAVPSLVQEGKPARVKLFGWNLDSSMADQLTAEQLTAEQLKTEQLSSVEVDLSAEVTNPTWPWPIRLSPSQATLRGFAYHLPGSQAAQFIGVTNTPVILDPGDNTASPRALTVTLPAEICGQLTAGSERDWYSFEAKRGEVLHIEAFGQRLRSPVDLQVSIVDASSGNELIQFTDVVRSQNEVLPFDHLDPSGKWVVPHDGHYYVAVRNLQGGFSADPRRIYRLSMRREEPDFDVVAVPRRDDPAGVNVPRGGREVLEIVALRRGGFQGPIRVAAKDLPTGIECPDVWLGPGVERSTLVISAEPSTAQLHGQLVLEASAAEVGIWNLKAQNVIARHVIGGTVVRTGQPLRWGRLTSQIPYSVTPDTQVRITADCDEVLNHHLYGKLQVRHAPGGVLDVAVTVERRDTTHQAAVRLLGIGVPDAIRNVTSIIPAGQNRGYLSFYLPPNLATGHYSLVIRAETTVPTADKKSATVVCYSNPVVFHVQPAAFLIEVDPFAPVRARRGETIQVSYTSLRRNGFIGKMHTELASPGRITDVVGLRGRGETFVGQTDKGSLQIIVNEDAPLGPQSFLRLFTVGVVEDEPIYHGASYLPLEITE